jgi:hypothetical protein
VEVFGVAGRPSEAGITPTDTGRRIGVFRTQAVHHSHWRQSGERRKMKAGYRLRTLLK